MIFNKTFIFNNFQENTYLLYDETKECIIIDAGCYSNDETNQITSFIETNKLKPVMLLNTHFHIDHILGLGELKKTYNIPIYGNTKDNSIIESAKEYGKQFGFTNIKSFKIDRNIDDKEIIKFGNSTLKALFVPGHTPGHLAFYSEENDFVIVGDVLFKGSIGRTDLPGGDLDVLYNSIKTKLLTLNDSTKVMPGHGYFTTISLEKKNNPFITDVLW